MKCLIILLIICGFIAFSHARNINSLENSAEVKDEAEDLKEHYRGKSSQQKDFQIQKKKHSSESIESKESEESDDSHEDKITRPTTTKNVPTPAITNVYFVETTTAFKVTLTTEEILTTGGQLPSQFSTNEVATIMPLSTLNVIDEKFSTMEFPAASELKTEIGEPETTSELSFV